MQQFPDTPVDILFIEDNLHDAEMTMRALKAHHVSNQIYHLKDGAEALDFLFGRGHYAGRDVNQHPRLVLLDIKMPKVDGIEVLAKIKNHELTKKIPVVMLTSSKEDPDIERCYELGANSYIVKPVAFDAFYKAVSELGFYWVLLNQPPA